MKEKLLLFLMTFIPINVAAFDEIIDKEIEIDGICYGLNTSAKTATVVQRFGSYSGDVDIPSSFYYATDGYRYSVTSIYDFAFIYCVGLTSVSIPSGVSVIGSNAFTGCTGLTSIVIPSSVTMIFDDAFSGCSSLTSISVSPRNPVYDSRNNCNAIIETATNKLVAGCKNTIIPINVTSIGGWAFSGCSGLTSIDIPKSVTSIEGWAFSGCSGLTSLTIPEQVTSIGGYAFNGCSGLTSVAIPNSVESIGRWAFQNCSSLSSMTIPNGVSSIEERTFYGCSNLTSITIPNSVTSIADDAFRGCIGLTSISVASGNTVYDSRNNCNAVIETASNKLILGCMKTRVPNSVTCIGDYAFFRCSSLTSIDIPSSVASIGSSAFYDCSGLTSVTIGNSVTSIGSSAFSGCSSLTSVEIPFSVTSIGRWAFSGCTGLTSVIVENSTPLSFDEYVFSGCYKATLYVPKGSRSVYQNTYPWSQFREIIEFTKQTLAFEEIPTMTYGDAAYTLPETTDQGKVLTWTSCDESVATISGHTLTISGAGSSIITAMYAGNGGNLPFSKDYTLTVGKAPLAITAMSYSINQGDELPIFEAEYSGFKNNETANALTTQPTFNCSATSSSPVGFYDITVSGAESSNYEITYVNGTLTVLSTTSAFTASVPTLHTGKTATVSISLDNEDTLIAFELYLQLPDGIRIAEDADGYPDVTLNSERSNRHQLDVEDEGDGLYHFLCYSSRNNALKGNSGELLIFDITCDNDMTAGNYQGTFRTIKFSDAGENLVLLADCPFDIKVIDYVMGDVNSDDDIDVMDIVMIVSHIMGRNPSSFIFAAADHNGDGIVDVMDLVRQVSLVMAQSASNAPSHHNIDAVGTGLSLVTDNDGAVQICLTDGRRYVATQFVVTLSEGQQLSGVTTDKRHTVGIKPLSGNRYFVMVYSTENVAFAANDQAMTLNVTGQGTVTVEDATFVDSDIQMFAFQNASTETTGISEASVNLSSSTDIYSVSGILMRKNATTTDNLPKGMYIINGKKMIVK